MNTFSLKVIACDRVFFDGRCKQVILPLEDGQKAIQAHHENMAFAVEVGEIRIQEENGNWIYGVTGTGFAQIMNNRATVIVDTCESPEDIDVRRAKEAKERKITRASVSMEHAAAIKKPVIFAVGNAPTALISLHELMVKEIFTPAFVIGVPVGFVNVEAAKELIIESGVPHIVNRGRKGGSNVAAAICNALIYGI